VAGRSRRYPSTLPPASRSQVVFFPEASDYIAEGKEQSLRLAQPLSGEFMTAIREAAKRHAVWVAVGVHQAVRPAGARRDAPGA